MSALLRYVLEEEIGRGATGVVYRAREQGPLQRTVALKRVRRPADASIAETVMREAEVLAGLDHPHIVRVYEVLPDGDGLAIVMQYAPGGSLAGLLERWGPLGAAQLGRLLLPVADALASAHRLGVIHRDIKPSNILLTLDGEALLSDFGVAGWAGRPTPHEGETHPGTLGYVDPALLKGRETSARCDVYGLGVTAFEALSGIPPFAGATADEVLAAADSGRHAPLRLLVPGLDPRVAAVVERAMQRDPDARHQSASAFAVALREALDPAPPRSVPHTGGVSTASGASTTSGLSTAGGASTGAPAGSVTPPTGPAYPVPPPGTDQLVLPHPASRLDPGAAPAPLPAPAAAHLAASARGTQTFPGRQPTATPRAEPSEINPASLEAAGISLPSPPAASPVPPSPDGAPSRGPASRRPWEGRPALAVVVVSAALVLTLAAELTVSGPDLARRLVLAEAPAVFAVLALLAVRSIRAAPRHPPSTGGSALQDPGESSGPQMQ